MVFFAVKIDYDERVNEVVKEFNKRLSFGGNPSLVFFDGKATLLLRNREQYLLFNVRINPFEPPFYKYVFYLMFKKSLKKKDYKQKTRIISNKELSRILEGYL